MSIDRAIELSVVMSVYNNADTLPAALESILSQEGVELEFIVVDDGSTDSSGEILDEAATLDSRLKVIHKQNEGLTQALIEGCAMASAPWVARQDADDLSLPGRLSAQLDRARQPDAPVLVGCAVFVKTPEGVMMTELHPPTDPVVAKKRVLDEGQAISSHGSILFSRVAYQKVGGYRPEFYYAQDIDLTTRLAEYGKVSAVEPFFYEYQFSPSAISGRHSSFQRAFYRLIRQGYVLRSAGESDQPILDAAERVKEQCLQARGDKTSSFGAYYFIGTCLRAHSSLAATHYFWLALRVRPWSTKAWVRLIQSIGGKKKRGDV